MLLLGDVVKLKTRSATSVQCTIMKGNVDKEKAATRKKDLDEKAKTAKSSSIILHTQNKKVYLRIFNL
jgi:predicted phosphodiesterase